MKQLNKYLLGAVLLLITFIAWYGFLIWGSPTFIEEKKITTKKSRDLEILRNIKTTTTTKAFAALRSFEDFENGSSVLNISGSKVLLMNVDEQYDRSEWFKEFTFSKNIKRNFEDTNVIRFQTNSIGEIVSIVSVSVPDYCTGKVLGVDLENGGIPLLNISELECEEFSDIKDLYVPTEIFYPEGSEKNVNLLSSYTGANILFLATKGESEEGLVSNYYATFLQEVL